MEASVGCWIGCLLCLFFLGLVRTKIGLLDQKKVASYFPVSVSCPGGHVQESAHAFSFLVGLFGVRHTASAFLGFAAFESAAQTIVREGAGVASDAYKRTVLEFTAVGPSSRLPIMPIWARSDRSFLI